MSSFTERHFEKIAFTLSCYDRIIITGSLVAVGHAEAMTRFIREQGILIFKYPDWAKQFREDIRAHVEKVTIDKGVAIDFIEEKNFRREERIKEILWQRGEHPGLVHISSARNPAIPSNHGTINKRAKPFSNHLPASVCTTISIS